MDETEKKILDAAMRVFASEGYKGATTRRIAQEANISEVTLFRKFQSKENLLREVIIKNKNRDIVHLAFDSLFQMEKDIDLATCLHTVSQNIAKAMKHRERDDRDLMFMSMLFEEGRRRPEVAQILSSIFRM